MESFSCLTRNINTDCFLWYLAGLQLVRSTEIRNKWVHQTEIYAFSCLVISWGAQKINWVAKTRFTQPGALIFFLCSLFLFLSIHSFFFSHSWHKMGTQVQKCREAQSSFLQVAEKRWSEHCICIFSFSTEEHCGFTYMQITTKLVSSFLSFSFWAYLRKTEEITQELPNSVPTTTMPSACL